VLLATPSVSVCIPVYNGETYLGETIRSVLDQTYGDFELVILDNGSTDKSGQIARSFGDHTFLLGALVGGNTGGQKLPAYDLFASGGFLRGSGYRPGALIGDRIQFARVLYYQKLVRQTLLEGMYAGLSVEVLKMGGSPAPNTPVGWIKSGSVYLGVDTILGPLYLAYGQSSGGLRSFYFYLGRPF